MAKQTINIGTAPNDGSGDPLRTAFTKANQNFDEVYLDIQTLEADSITETELNTALSFKVDKVTGKGLSTEDYTTSEKSALAFVTKPATGTLTTGSNSIDLTNGFGKAYHPYDMASGELTLTVAANPVEGATAHGIIKADGSTLPTVSAFTLLTGEYVNTNDVENHFFISYKYNGSNVLTAYLQWAQPA